MYKNHLTFYNIFRDKSTDVHAQQQQKVHYDLSTDYEFYKYQSKINFKTKLLNQFYKIENGLEGKIPSNPLKRLGGDRGLEPRTR